jgi:hypothetical protein
MDQEPDDSGSKRYRALKDRYPAPPAAQERLVMDEVRALRQVVGELSEVVSALVAYLIDTSRQADTGNTGAEPENQARLHSLRADVDALREGLPDV